MAGLTVWLGATSAVAQPESRERDREAEIAALAGNEQVAEILRTRPGRGVLADDSQPTPPDQSLATFQLRPGLRIELVASEPEITQPLFLSWDSAGRMWVVQYRQYQYPAGLKVVRFDQHLRAVFDRVPAPPPNHVPGADVISVLEDTTGDGRYDRQRDVITGLSIATSVAIGQGGIWVLNPPYLLRYPDADGDGQPDGDPQVHLAGFGLQDTHSVANSLMWGPDGWLYGANGSTTAGTIVSAATPGTRFEGQCIWRYHPTRQVFEIYAEGGGNTFSLDIDAQGRVFSGTNGGGTRGWYYPQGSYSQKNWGKHGPLTNPFALGFLHPMKSQGDDRRFPQAFMIYDGGLLGPELAGCVIAPNSMHNLVWHSRRYADGSTFRTVDEPNLLQSSDRWFRPVYGGVGPDGAIYLADWYDTRLSHVSPIDDWHKGSGRIYRILPTHAPIATAELSSGGGYRLLDLSGMTAQQLIECFQHPNKWVRQRAALELGWQQQRSVVPRLLELVNQAGSLEALWALNLLEELTTERAALWLGHADPHIRRWVVRLLGDRHQGHPGLAELAARESDVEVRSQLAATARRIDADHALPLIQQLLARDEDLADPHLPLMIWWALEAHAEQFEAVLDLVRQPGPWQGQLMREVIAERLMQRYAAAGTADDLDRCRQLLELPLDPSQRETLVVGLNKAFQGRVLPPSLPPAIEQALREYRDSRGSAGIVLAAGQGDPAALETALHWLRDNRQDVGLRMEVARVFGQRRYAAALDGLLSLATGRATQEPALQRVALQSLAVYEEERIGREIAAAFDSTISAEHNLRDTACRTLATRKPWALILLGEINQWRVRGQDVPADVVSQLRVYDDPEIAAEVARAFGEPKAVDSPEQVAEMQRLSEVLQPLFAGLPKRRSVDPTLLAADTAADPVTDTAADAHPGELSPLNRFDVEAGQQLYADRCGKCHQLFGRGEKVGPPLDNYDRQNLHFWLTAIVAPSAEIREGYQSYSVLTQDGRVLTGMLAAQDLNTTTVRTAEQQLITLANDEIESLQAMSVSLMPEGLLKDLEPRQLLDLFAYLTAGAR